MEDSYLRYSMSVIIAEPCLMSVTASSRCTAAFYTP